jgi:beta-galactosidase
LQYEKNLENNKVGVLYSHDSYHALRFMPYTGKDPYPAGKELLSGDKIEKSEEISLMPWDVKIIEGNL